MKSDQLIKQVCKLEDCDNKPEKVLVGNQHHTFCCMKGFEKSLADFNEFLKNGKTCQNN